MTTDENRKLFEIIFVELAKGNGALFRDAMADDLSWSIIGSHQLVARVPRQAGRRAGLAATAPRPVQG